MSVIVNEKLPLGDPEEFIGEFENMDLNELKNGLFMVAISHGNPDQCKYIPETISGPFGFCEMVERVRDMWIDKQLHAKVILPNRDGKPPRFLDECTVDYIEAKGVDIIMQYTMLDEGQHMTDEDFTCRAGVFECPLSNETSEESKDD